LLKDELKTLQEMAASFLAEDQVPWSTYPQKPEEQHLAMVTEARRVKMAWSALLSSSAKDYVLKRYITYHQTLLVDLSDRLFVWLTNKGQSHVSDLPPGWLAPGQVLLDCLLKLLAFLEQYFEAYFNSAGKLPEALIGDALNEIGGHAAAIARVLNEQGIEQSLKQCLTDYLEMLPQESYRPKLNFRTAQYVRDMALFLNPAHRNHQEDDWNSIITDNLLYLNFNFRGFLSWYREKINRKISMLPTSEERLLFLIEELVRIKTSPVMLSVAGELSLPPLAELLENCLNEMIKKESGRYFPREPEDSEKKLGLSLSVTQLSLFIRLLYEEGFFTLKNITAILRFTAKHFTTKRQEHISAVNMGRTYYGTDQFTAAAVKDLLIRMLARLNRIFFPLIALTIILCTS
jgi:hypothetical protein